MSIIQIFHMQSSLQRFLQLLQNLCILFSVNGKLTESLACNMIFIYHTLIMGYFISSKLLVDNSIKVEQLSGPSVTLNS